MFQKYPNADCIVYDNEDCTTDDVAKPLAVSRGQTIRIDPKDELADTIEAVSVRLGCDLTVWTGILYFL